MVRAPKWYRQRAHPVARVETITLGALDSTIQSALRDGLITHAEWAGIVARAAEVQRRVVRVVASAGAMGRGA